MRGSEKSKVCKSGISETSEELVVGIDHIISKVKMAVTIFAISQKKKLYCRKTTKR